MTADFFLGVYAGGFLVTAVMTRGDLVNRLVSAAVWLIFLPYCLATSR